MSEPHRDRSAQCGGVSLATAGYRGEFGKVAAATGIDGSLVNATGTRIGHGI